MKKIELTFNDETKKVAFTEPQAKIMERLLSGVTAYSEDDLLYWDDDEWGEEQSFMHRIDEDDFYGALERIVKAFGLSTEEKQMLYDRYIF